MIIIDGSQWEKVQELMADDAKVFFITEHYYNYPYVLVQLKKIRKAKLRQLIRQSWIELAGEKLRRKWEG